MALSAHGAGRLRKLLTTGASRAGAVAQWDRVPAERSGGRSKRQHGYPARTASAGHLPARRSGGGLNADRPRRRAATSPVGCWRTGSCNPDRLSTLPASSNPLPCSPSWTRRSGRKTPRPVPPAGPMLLEQRRSGGDQRGLDRIGQIVVRGADRDVPRETHAQDALPVAVGRKRVHRATPAGHVPAVHQGTDRLGSLRPGCALGHVVGASRVGLPS